MIKNDKQLNEAKKRLKIWVRSFDQMERELSPELYEVYKTTHRHIISDLKKLIEEYERLVAGKIPQPHFESPFDLGRWLVKSRIGMGLTQSQMAKDIGVSQAQISRDEDAEYRNASFLRICKIAKYFGYPVLRLTFMKKALSENIWGRLNLITRVHVDDSDEAYPATRNSFAASRYGSSHYQNLRGLNG